MIAELNRLSQPETELMLKAPILVCILIAGADNHIDNREVKGAIELAKEKEKKVKRSRLSQYYVEVTEDFEDKLKIVLQSYPVDGAKRNAMITQELNGLNEILPNLDKEFATEFYESMKEIAVRIAESSGGLLGIKSIGQEEARLVELPMVNDPSKS